MAKNEITLKQAEDFQKGYLTLPFDESQFKDFISALLGKPQTITKKIRGNFEIHLKDLQNFHELLNQRIAQQNNGHLIQLKTKIIFSDESTVMLSSYEELITYNEVKPIISQAVVMTWTYLIQFADKKIPEKQEIELLIISSPYFAITEEDDLPVNLSRSGQFRISIRHTARTWGFDIETLLTNQIKSILKKTPTWKSFCERNKALIGFLAAGVFFLSCLTGLIININSTFEKQYKATNEFLQNAQNDLPKKIDKLIKTTIGDEQNFYLFNVMLYFTIAFLIAVIISKWVSSLANNRPRSYLVLTRESLTQRNKLEGQKKFKVVLFISSIIISIIAGIVSNYLFSWLTNK